MVSIGIPNHPKSRHFSIETDGDYCEVRLLKKPPYQQTCCIFSPPQIQSYAAASLASLFDCWGLSGDQICVNV